MSDPAAPDPILDSPYASAGDLPIARELYQQMLGYKLIGFILPRRIRAQMREIKSGLDSLVATVDGFYEILGPRNWVFHESMNVPRIKELVESTSEPAEAERALIAYYREPDTLRYATMRLAGLAPMRPRMDLIQKAVADYAAGRYYAVALVLIAVMDGFVNEVDTSRRRGLHTREPEEMNAWGSVTAHHMGLSRSLREFTRSFKATKTAEVFELNRNGIMHGTIINYDNPVVATKAWNMLFAVADWAQVVLNPPKPKKPQPTWTELGQQLATTARRKKALEEWTPSEEGVSLDAAEDGTALAACVAYADAWKHRRFDLLGQMFLTFGDKRPVSDGAQEARSLYADNPLMDYELLRVRRPGACIALIDAKLLVNGVWHETQLRWLYVEPETGSMSFPGEPGAWMIAPHGPAVFLRPHDHRSNTER